MCIMYVYRRYNIVFVEVKMMKKYECPDLEVVTFEEEIMSDLVFSIIGNEDGGEY